MNLATLLNAAEIPYSTDAFGEPRSMTISNNSNDSLNMSDVTESDAERKDLGIKMLFLAAVSLHEDEESVADISPSNSYHDLRRASSGSFQSLLKAVSFQDSFMPRSYSTSTMGSLKPGSKKRCSNEECNCVITMPHWRYIIQDGASSENPRGNPYCVACFKYYEQYRQMRPKSMINPAQVSHEKQCSNPNCKTTTASNWRYLKIDEFHQNPYCSPCKLYYDVHGVQRPENLVKQPKKQQRLHKIPHSERVCTACKTTATPLWRFVGDELHCNSCAQRKNKKGRQNRSPKPAR
jgi:hypothetical protein